jgi:hypothetical protein
MKYDKTQLNTGRLNILVPPPLSKSQPYHCPLTTGGVDGRGSLSTLTKLASHFQGENAGTSYPCLCYAVGPSVFMNPNYSLRCALQFSFSFIASLLLVLFFFFLHFFIRRQFSILFNCSVPFLVAKPIIFY